MKQYYRHALFFIFSLSLLAGCEKAPPVQPSGKSVKIGIIAPLSGPELYKGKEGLKGIRFILESTPLLENGDKLELVIRDDRNDPALSIKALEELTNKHHVSAILTLSGSNAVLGLSSVVDQFKTPVIALLATNPGITRDNHYVSQLGFNDQFQGVAAALFVHDELLIDRVAIFRNSKNIYSSDLANTFKQKFQAIKGQILFDSDFITNPAMLNKSLIELRNKKVQLLYLPVKASEVVKIKMALNNLNWQPKIMGTDGLLSTILTKYKDDTHKFDGILSTDFYSSDVPLTSFGSKTKTGYENIHGNLTSYSMMGIEGVTLLKSVVNQCPAPLTKECIRELLRSGISYTGLINKITLNPESEAQRVLLVNEIKNGKLNYIVQIY